jgi:hypothetical protein
VTTEPTQSRAELMNASYQLAYGQVIETTPLAPKPARPRQRPGNHHLATAFLKTVAKKTQGKAVSLAELQAAYQVHERRVRKTQNRK